MSSVTQSTTQQLLASGDLVVVPSDAATRQLRNLHDTNQTSQGRKAWQPANVLTWDQWLRSLWSEAVTNGCEDRLLLNSAQEHSLWREIVQTQQSGAPESLSSVDALAELAASAWRLSESYGATSRLRQYANTHDTRIFAEWAEAFARVCQTEGYVSRASLEAAVGVIAARNKPHSPQRLTFAGFAKWTPAQAELLQILRRNGGSVSETQIIAPDQAPSERFLFQADNEDLELEAIAQWIRQFITSRTADGRTATAAVLVPDLEAHRDKVNSIFRRVLAPELEHITAECSVGPFEIALSEPLHTQPMIAAALDLVRWAAGPLHRDAASALLLSPYLASELELENAAKFDACTLRRAKLLRPQIDLRWLVKQLRRTGEAASINWPISLAKFLDSAESPDAARSFGQWTEYFRRLVRSAGWPGTRTQNAKEIATALAWDHALDSIATLDFNGGRVMFAGAVEALERELSHAASTSSTGQPLVLIMRPSDIDGMTFDALIFARATDQHWPSLPQVNPLIGWPLQSKLGMPGFNRRVEMAEARRATAHLLTAAGTAIFSYSTTDTEGEQRLSPLIAELQLPIRDAASFLLTGYAAPNEIQPEIVEDAEPLPPLPSSHIHGGAAIIQHQAACGFRAFAEIRLRSQELQSSDLGYDARDRGNLLHSVMQRFWSEVRTQRALRSIPPQDRHDLLVRILDEFLSRQTSEANGWDAAYLQLQKQRLARLLNHWLNTELQRSEFEVLTTELKEELTLGPLDLQVRVDRIDRVENGFFLVDYKTGSAASPADWEGDRPDEPQLPLYALLPEADELAGLAFAKVRPGKTMGWFGYASAASVLPGRDTSRDLAVLQEEWRTHLTALAESFAAGDAGVRPKSYPTTCTFCTQRLLCRLDAATLLSTEDLDDTTLEEELVHD